jgi:phosphatidylglycerophosphate synthase
MSPKPESVLAVIDARDGDKAWFGDTSGLPVIVRTLLCLRHAGFKEAVLVGRDVGERARTRAEKHPYHALELSVVDEMPEVDERPRLVFTTQVVLPSSTAEALAERATPEGYEVPTELPEGMPGFLLPARNRAERGRGAKALRNACRKPVEDAGAVSALVLQHIALQISRPISHLPVTPNAVTITAFFIGLATLPFFIDGSRNAILIASCMLMVNNVMDDLDGEIARIKYRFSSLGERLDHVADMILGVLLPAPVGIGLHHATGYAFWEVLGWAGSIGWLTYTATVQYYVSKVKHTGYTTGFRFWYRIPKGETSQTYVPEPKKIIKGPKRYMQSKYLFRKDFAYSLYFITGLLWYHEIAFSLSIFGGIEYGLLSLIQLTLFHNKVQFRGSHLGSV